MTVHELFDSVSQASKIFHSLRPEKNINMFSHFPLMADIRVYYVSFMEIEKEVNSDNFTRVKYPFILPV